MRPAPSRFLSQLAVAITAAPTPLVADCLRAERACYLARQGHMEEARSVVTTLRKQYAGAPNAAMSAWLSLAEGLESYFTNLGEGSRDKVLRAHALSAAAGLLPMQALSAAWLSQMDFSRLDSESLSRHARQALQLAAPNEHSARSRVSLVIAQALHLAGRPGLAAPWYRRAHSHATAQGDDATLSALIHNMACMRMDNIRQFKLSGTGESSDTNIVSTGTASAGNFDQLIGASSLKALNPLMRARVLSLQDRHAEALSQYEEHISIDVENGFSRMRSDLQSDVAWCLFRLQKQDEALRLAVEAEASLSPATQIDDRAATHTRLGWLYLAVGESEAAQRHQMLATQAWVSFTQWQERTAKMLEAFSETG